MTRGRFAVTPATTAWRLWIAPAVWALHFLAIYGFTALACARNAPTGLLGIHAVPWLVGGATVVATSLLLSTIWTAVRNGRHRASTDATVFVHWLTAATACIVLIAIAWETLPIFLVPVCA